MDVIPLFPFPRRLYIVTVWSPVSPSLRHHSPGHVTDGPRMTTWVTQWRLSANQSPSEQYSGQSEARIHSPLEES